MRSCQTNRARPEELQVEDATVLDDFQEGILEEIKEENSDDVISINLRGE